MQHFGWRTSTQDAEAPPKQIRLFGDYLCARSRALLGHLLRAAPEDPTRLATFHPGAPIPRYPPKRRVGRPRLHWAVEEMKSVWEEFQLAPEAFDPKSDEHALLLQALAQERRF